MSSIDETSSKHVKMWALPAEKINHLDPYR